MIRNICITDTSTMTVTEYIEVVAICEGVTIEEVTKVIEAISVSEINKYIEEDFEIFDDGGPAYFMYPWVTKKSNYRKCRKMTYQEFKKEFMLNNAEPTKYKILYTLPKETKHVKH